jgi:hypothetical protein
MTKAFVNKCDNSVCFIETAQDRIHPSMETNEDIFLVEVDESCFEGVNPDEWLGMFYDEVNNILFLDEAYKTMGTQRGNAWLIEELRRFALVPLNARGEEYEKIYSLAIRYIPEEEVNEIMSDGILSDDEVQDILGYLNAD